MQKLCECGCGAATPLYTKTNFKRGRVKGCPARFVHGHNGRKPLAERLARKLVADPVTGCNEWQGALTNKGYGWVSTEGGPQLVHRAVWELENGPIPEGLFVLHRCDNRRCGNLLHLFLGTDLSNVRDMVAKDRHARGERNGHAKLNDSAVLQLRSGQMSASQAKTQFKVSGRTARDALRSVTWRHLASEENST
jgi:hypothetical protein